MKTVQELAELRSNVAKSIFAYHNAIFNNLKESGKEYNILPFDDETNGIRLDYDGVSNVIDKVRYAKRGSGVELIECHCCEENFKEVDQWFNIDYWCEDADYIYDAIIWDDDESDNSTKYICPECGHVFEQGEYDFNYDTALLDFVCPECDWEGNENQLEQDDDDKC